MKRAFTMIELILTIVILAISTMAIPRIIKQTAELNEFAIEQEMIYHAKTRLSHIMQAPWDSGYLVNDDECKNKEDSCNPTLPPIFELDDAGIKVPDYRYGLKQISAASTVGFTTVKPTDPDDFRDVSYGNQYIFGRDIDDHDGNITNIAPTPVTGATLDMQQDFLINQQLQTTVSYVSDDIINIAGKNCATGNDAYIKGEVVCANLGVVAEANPTNIKMVEVKNTDLSSKANAAGEQRFLVLRGYAFNIGSLRAKVGKVED